MTRLPYKLLVFDWDGTLIDSIGTIVACTQATLDELQLPPLPDQAIRQTPVAAERTGIQAEPTQNRFTGADQ